MQAKAMQPALRLAGYCRISVDVEADRDNTSIENQKSIISDYVEKHFPGSELTFYVDRDRSGYTFEQRESYQQMRPRLMLGDYDILIVKDLSRFSRRNSRGLVELEDLRDAGVRIIAIGDSIDYPTHDDWTNIRLRFLLNEMPVTDSSQKVKSVIQRRQQDGKWVCSVPYGYVITNHKTMTYEVDEAAAAVVRKIFDLYNDGWGYKRIANYLTDQGIPTPRMTEKARIEADGTPCKLKARPEWSIITVSGILQNDFYIGTLRQGKYRRRGINGKDFKQKDDDHIVFEKHHEAIVDYRTFAYTQEQMKKRTTSAYRGVGKYHNPYSGFLYCGDCGSPMFAMSRADLAPAYTCGSYHRRGRKGCTAHHTRMDLLDALLKKYILRIKQNSAFMLETLDRAVAQEQETIEQGETTLALLERQIEQVKEHRKLLTKQKLAELMRKPEQEDIINETYDELEAEDAAKLKGLQNQLEMFADHRNNVIRVNRLARTALEIFDSILAKDRLDKKDLEFLIERITVYEDRIDIQLKADVDALLHVSQSEAIEQAANGEKITYNPPAHSPVREKTVTVVSSGDPLEILIHFTNAALQIIFYLIPLNWLKILIEMPGTLPGRVHIRILTSTFKYSIFLVNIGHSNANPSSLHVILPFPLRCRAMQLSMRAQAGESLLTQRFIQQNGHRIGQVQAARVGSHGNAHAALVVIGQQRLIQPLRFAAKHQKIAVLIGCGAIIARSLRGSEMQACIRVFFRKIRPAFMNLKRHQMPVI